MLSKLWPIPYLDTWKIPFSRRRRMFQLLQEFGRHGDTRNPSDVLKMQEVPDK